LVDNPNNGGVVLLMAQALFAMGHNDEAAGAVQMAMQTLPESEWGNVVKNYTQIYGNIGDYTNQLKALERARDAKTDSAPIRFLLGYHFGYLGYPKQAVRELDKALDLIPQDLGSQKLRDIFAVQAGLPARAPAKIPEQAPGTGPAPGAGPGVPTPPAGGAAPAGTPQSTTAVGTEVPS
jgi:tetratricopeptide (TPR) repeat protein